MTEHIQYHCPPGCDEPYCMYCIGGLFSCTVCRGAEGSLPTDCPGRRMTSEEQDAVYAGTLDYKDGRWVLPSEQLEFEWTPNPSSQTSRPNPAPTSRKSEEETTLPTSQPES